MRWLTIAAAVAALALGLTVAGCGGGDDEASDEPDTTITDTETTDDTTTDETTEDTETDTNATPDFTSEDCQGLLAAYLAFSQALGTGSGDTDLSEQADAFDAFADKVPAEIEEDVQTLAAAYRTYAEALAGIDLGSGEVPSADQLAQIQEATTSLGPEVTAASERLSAWTQENCTS